MKIILLLILGIEIFSQGDTLKVNYGRHVLPNGKFAANEWDDVAELRLENELILLLKQDAQYLYLGIEFLKEAHTGVDLYLADSDSNMRMLHVSSALGEKDFIKEEWSDFIWGENDLWMANTIGMISENGKTKFLENEGFEFQINKSFFKKGEWFVMIHLKRPELIFPPNADNNSIQNWFQILF